MGRQALHSAGHIPEAAKIFRIRLHKKMGI
jgi:hypothetical protein